MTLVYRQKQNRRYSASIKIIGQKYLSKMTFLYTLTGGTRKQKEKKKFSLLKYIQKLNVIEKKNCVFVFSFMYLVSVDPMDRSQVTPSNTQK